ncbi:uncharacterized protein FIESC28_02734 [Fusarium coffeatum]|uniref:Uncharacterized protein n=1 Tax=Fusarium coffeatum TaxID=231269 RepID=A0A366S543_9HYPO|nr:uncharacterized protein FIESC28_02734 [Fusarium coffeatum]RBR24443.1 hypothetical protein FIESC28_02734 [Fusarium coffeatum]
MSPDQERLLYIVSCLDVLYPNKAYVRSLLFWASLFRPCMASVPGISANTEQARPLPLTLPTLRPAKTHDSSNDTPSCSNTADYHSGTPSLSIDSFSSGTVNSVLLEAAGLFLGLERPGPIAQDGFVDAAKAYYRMQNRIRTQNTRLHESSEKKVKRCEQHKSYYKKKVANETLAQRTQQLGRDRARAQDKKADKTAVDKRSRLDRDNSYRKSKRSNETPGERKKRLTYRQTAYYKLRLQEETHWVIADTAFSTNMNPIIIDDDGDAHMEAPPPRAPGPVRRDLGRAQEARMHPYSQSQGVRNSNRMSLQTIQDTMSYTNHRQANMIIRGGADLILTEFNEISTILKSLALKMDTPATTFRF